MKKSNFEAILAEIPADRLPMAEDIIEEIRFTKKLLAQLKKVIKDRGVAELYPKGRQLCLRESPAVKSYNQLVQKFSLLYRQLENLLPKAQNPSAGNELISFLQAS